MQAPSFWQRDGGLASTLLAPFAFLYGGIAERRFRQPGKSVGIPLLCVGNPTLGGAGKTPTALAVGELLIAAGERPYFLSRGYGGSLAGPVRVDPARHRAAEVGDEPLLLTRVAPTIVARDRLAGAETAQRAGASVIVMDDGFQNPSLTKTLSILVIDGARGIGNGSVFPAGPLRLPVGVQLDCAHALIVVGEGNGSAPVVAAARVRALPVFAARLRPEPHALDGLAGQRVLAFAGIGDPDKFFATLARAGIDVAIRRPFPDHHRYVMDEGRALLAEADKHKLLLVTTEKDFVRFAAELPELAARAHALPVSLIVEAAEEFRRFVLSAVKPDPV